METKIYTIICASTFNDSTSDMSIEIIGTYTNENDAICAFDEMIQDKVKEGLFCDDDIVDNWRDSKTIITDESTFLYEIKEQIINI